MSFEHGVEITYETEDDGDLDLDTLILISEIRKMFQLLLMF